MIRRYTNFVLSISDRGQIRMRKGVLDRASSQRVESEHSVEQIKGKRTSSGDEFVPRNTWFEAKLDEKLSRLFFSQGVDVIQRGCAQDVRDADDLVNVITSLEEGFPEHHLSKDTSH